MVNEISSTPLFALTPNKKTEKSKTKEEVRGKERFSVTPHPTDSAAEASGELASASAPLSVESVNALFETLSNLDSTNQAAIDHGHQILDELEVVRHSLLVGAVPPQTLKNLDQLAQAYLKEAPNKMIQKIVLEIQTRAKVEIAKLEVAQKANSL